MSQSTYQNLIQMGRKAGLNTADLYRALSTRQPDRQMSQAGQADCNGFITGISQGGRTEYHQAKPQS